MQESYHLAQRQVRMEGAVFKQRLLKCIRPENVPVFESLEFGIDGVVSFH